VGTANLEALAKDGVLVTSRVPMIGPTSGATSVAQAGGMLVIKASYRDEIDRLFNQLSHLGIQRVGIVYQDDGLGKDALAGAEQAAPKFGMTLVGRSGYPRNTVEVRAAVTEMLKTSPAVIFLGATTAAGIEFVKLYGEAGGHAMIYGMSIIDTDALLKTLGPDRARGYAFSTVLPTSMQTNWAVVREYQSLRSAAKDPDLSARSIEGFIAAKVLIQALEKTPHFTAEAVAATLGGSSRMDVGGYALDFTTPGRSGSRYVDFAMIGAGGKIVR
jgi:ABC-type branched-subunit amino acid transport system substrate-binding protein